jgi:hypothetical protein
VWGGEKTKTHPWKVYVQQLDENKIYGLSV